MTLTQAQLDIVRTRPHRTKLWLSIFKPNIVLSAQINDPSIDKNARLITYDNVTAGNPALIENGQTMYLGASAGSNDYGRVRVRSESGGIITVAENSDIPWVNDRYITVTDFHEIQAVFPRIIPDPADATKTLWYKDWDIAYTDQNTNMGSMVCMGSHFAGFLESGECNVYYTSSGTSSMVTGSYTCHWYFQGATTAESTDITPGLITYDTPGHYTTKLVVTSSSTTDTSYRHISIYDRPGNGTNTPILQWSLSKLTGSRGSGGYSATIKIFEQIDESSVRDGSLIVIFADEWYGNTKQSIGGNADNRNTIVFVGYVVDGSINFNYKDKTIEFEVASPVGIMKNSEGFSVSLEDIDDPVTRNTTDPGNYPSPWVLVPGLGVKKAVYHYLKWHSTVMECTDIQFIATDQLIQYFDADRENLYNAINSIVSSAILGRVVSDIQGKLWVEDEPYISPPLSRSVLSLDNQDWVGDPDIDLVLTKKTSYIEMGGIAYTGFGGTSTPYLSGSPGQSPGYHGSVERIQGLAITSQSQLNGHAGLTYSHRNRKYPSISFNMSGNYRVLDITPVNRHRIYIPANKNPRNKIIDIDTYIENIDWAYNPEKEIFTPKVVFSEIASGVVAETLEIPPIAPTEGDDGGFTIPPISIPPITIPPITIAGQGLTFIPAYYLMNYSDSTILRTDTVKPFYSNYGIYLTSAKTYDFWVALMGSGIASAYSFSPVFMYSNSGASTSYIIEGSVTLEAYTMSSYGTYEGGSSKVYKYFVVSPSEINVPIGGEFIHVVTAFAYTIATSTGKIITCKIQFKPTFSTGYSDALSFSGVAVNY